MAITGQAWTVAPGIGHFVDEKVDVNSLGTQRHGSDHCQGECLWALLWFRPRLRAPWPCALTVSTPPSPLTSGVFVVDKGFSHVWLSGARQGAYFTKCLLQVVYTSSAFRGRAPGPPAVAGSRAAVGTRTSRRTRCTSGTTSSALRGKAPRPFWPASGPRPRFGGLAVLRVQLHGGPAVRMCRCQSGPVPSGG